MFCSYHSSSAAKVQCTSCSRALCGACDHRIKGFPYCQDCIVLGIQTLSRGYNRPKRGRARSAAAALLGFIPGLGAVFNRQNFKAVVHFVTVVGLFQLTRLHVMPGLFFLGGMVTYVYSIIDAYRSAELIANGVSAEVDEERFKRSLVSRAPVIGILLIIVGLIVVIQLVTPIAAWTLARLLPVALIVLGGYLLTRYFKRSRDDYSTNDSDRSTYPLMTGTFAEHSRSEVRKIP